MKMQKLYFFKSPPRTGYFAGKTHEVPEDKATEYIKAGYAREATKVLDESVPFRAKLIKAGIETEDDIKRADISKLGLTQDEERVIRNRYLTDKGIETEELMALPEDIPGYDHLIDAGIKTVEEVMAMKDITKVHGIGKATAKDIQDYLGE
jgi:hypothetical protein